MDALVKSGAGKDEIDVICQLSIKKIQSIVRKEQYCVERGRRMREHAKSVTFSHYDKVSDPVAVTYGKEGTLSESVKMRGG